MPDLKDLLGKFKDSLESDASRREKISQTIKEVCGFEVRLTDINLKNAVLRIDTTPTKKSEIKLHGADLLKKLNEKGIAVKTLY